MDLLAPDVTRIAPERSDGSKDPAPDELASRTPEPLRGELIELLGDDRVLTRVIDLVRYASDASPYRLIPKAVVVARDSRDVAEVFGYARRTGTPRGGRCFRLCAPHRHARRVARRRSQPERPGANRWDPRGRSPPLARRR